MNTVQIFGFNSTTSSFDRLDTFDDEIIRLTQSIQDIKDPGKVFTNFTQTFSLPAIKYNNKYFKHIEKSEIVTPAINARKKVKGGTDSRISKERYVKNMQAYLKDGVGKDLFYGERKKYKMECSCAAMAYDHEGPNKGRPKRNVGVWYPDIGRVYGMNAIDAADARFEDACNHILMLAENMPDDTSLE